MVAGGGRDQSALLETMCPLLLSSELPRDGDDMAIGGVDSSRAASGHLKLAPSTLLPLVKTTRREEEVMMGLIDDVSLFSRSTCGTYDTTESGV